MIKTINSKTGTLSIIQQNQKKIKKSRRKIPDIIDINSEICKNEISKLESNPSLHENIVKYNWSKELLYYEQVGTISEIKISPKSNKCKH